MVKMKHIKCYKQDDVPDHLIQEVEELMNKIVAVLRPMINDASPNILMSAFNRLHAALVVTLITEDPEEIRNATVSEVKALIGNIEDIANIKVFEEKGEDNAQTS